MNFVNIPAAGRYFHSFIVLIFLILANGQVFACFCVTPEYERCFEDADVVVTGRISTFNLQDSINGFSDCGGFFEQAVVLDIRENLKGPFAAGCKLVILQGGSNCSYLFDSDSSYIVFGKFIKEPYTGSNLPAISTAQCTGTATVELNDKQDLLAHENCNSSQQKEPSNFSSLMILGSVLLNFLLALLLLRRKSLV